MKRLLIAAASLWTPFAAAQSTFLDSCGSSDWFSTCTLGNACGPGQNGCLNNWFGSAECGTDCPLPFPGPASHVVVPAGGVISINGGAADINSLECSRPFTLNGNVRVRANSAIRAGLNWLSGDLGATATGTEFYFPAASTLSISGGGGKSISAASLVLDQAATWSGGSIGMSSGAQIVSNAFFNVNCDTSMIHTGGAIAAFENHGEFRKLGGTGITTIGVTFNNHDEIIVSNGTLRMSNSGTCRGPITLDGFSVFETAFGNYNFAAGTSVQGAGLLRVNGQLNLLDPVTVDKIELQTNLNGPGDLRVLLDMHWPSGTMFGGGVTRIPSFAALRLTGAPGKALSNRSIANEGGMSIDGGPLQISSGSNITNSGTLDVQSDTSISFVGGAPCLIENSGTLQKSGGVGTSVISATFNSTGSVDVQSGTLRLSNSGLGTGPFTIGPAAILEFAFGSYNLGDGASVSGEGLARLNGTTNLLATVPIEHSEFTSSLVGPGDLIVTDTMLWLSGTMSGGGVTRIPAVATLTLSGGSAKALSNRSIANEGSMSIDGGPLQISSGSNITNSGTLDVKSDTSISYVGGVPCLIENSGTLQKSGGTGTSVISATFNSTGSVDVQSGTLRLSNSGLGTGPFTVGPASILEFAFGTYNLGDGASVSGDGLARLNGTTNLLANVSIENSELTTSLVGPGDLVVADTMRWLSGTMSGGGTTVIPAAAQFTLDSASAKALANRDLLVDGTAQLVGNASLALNSSSDVTNNGLFEIQGDPTIAYTGGPACSFSNAGALRKTAGSGIAVFSGLPLNNSGSVEVQSGTLRLSNDGRSTGGFDLSPGTILEFAFGSYRLDTGAAVTGDGLARMNGTTILLDDVPFENVELTSRLVGPGDLLVQNEMDWSSGTMDSGGTTIIEPAASLTISGGSGKGLSARSIRNRGTATVSGVGSVAMTSGAAFINEGTLDLLAGNTIVYQGGVSCLFSNAGSISKKTGSGTTQIASMPLNNTGTIEVLGGVLVATNLAQSYGATRVSSGATLQCTAPMALGGGSLSGGGQLAGAVQNTGGRTQPGDGVGRLTISGSYSQSSGGGLDIEIAGTTAASEHDQLAVGATATLGGELRLAFVGGFTPQPGDSFTVLTAASIIGTFSSVTGAGQFDVTYTPTSVVVTVVAPPCVGDLNGDLQVNLTDLSTLLANFGLSGGATLAQGDLNGDGNVNLTDLAVLLANFGVNC